MDGELWAKIRDSPWTSFSGNAACQASVSWAGVFWQLLSSLEWRVSLPYSSTPEN